MNRREALRKVGISEEMIEWILDEREFVVPCDPERPQFVQSVLSDQVTPLPAQASSGPRGILVEVYSRVVGYFRPVKQWNKGKREEFGERREYRLGGGRFQPNPCEELDKQDQEPAALQAEPGVWREG